MLGLAIGCNRDQLTSPHEFLEVPRPSASVSPLPPVSVSLPIVSPTDASIAGNPDLGTYPDSLIADISATGTIAATGLPNATIDPRGMITRESDPQCGLMLVLSVPSVGTFGPSSCPAMWRQDTPRDWRDTVLIYGHPTLVRGPRLFQYTAECGYSPCWTYSGSQQFTLTPLAAKLKLSGSLHYISPPTQVVFAPYALPDSIHHIRVPVRVISWAWHADLGAGATAACAPGTAVCTTAVQEAGYMTVAAVVNGIVQIDSARVDVVQCATRDSILDNPSVRAALQEVWLQSHSDTQPTSARVERGFYIIDSAGTIVSRLSPRQLSDLPCSNANTPPAINVALGERYLILVHTHPFAIGDTVPVNCGSPNDPPGTMRYYAHSISGFSPADQIRVYDDSVSTNGDVRSIYVMDRDSIYFSSPPPVVVTVQTPKGEEQMLPRDFTVAKNARSWPRIDPNQASCTRP